MLIKNRNQNIVMVMIFFVQTWWIISKFKEYFSRKDTVIVERK